MTAQGEQRRAAVVGTGLIGGSVALALQAAGWHVTGSDIDPARAERALQLGVINSVGSDPDAEITFLAVPVSSVADAAREALRSGWRSWRPLRCNDVGLDPNCSHGPCRSGAGSFGGSLLWSRGADT